MIIAKLKHLRMSPRKVRLVADLVRGLSIEEAERQLRFLAKKSAGPILKLLDSAVANAKQNFDLVKDNLYIAKIVVESGKPLKRWRPRAMGRAMPIMKRTSHIIISLEQKNILSQEKKLDKKVESKLAKEKKELLPRGKIIAELPKKEKEIPLDSKHPIEQIEDKKEPSLKTRTVMTQKPYSATSKSKKRFSSRQSADSARKMFRRKKI